MNWPFGQWRRRRELPGSLPLVAYFELNPRGRFPESNGAAAHLI
jgi:hypothetical protein